MSGRRLLTNAQARYVRKAYQLRKRLTAKLLAARFGVHVNTIYWHAHGKSKW